MRRTRNESGASLVEFAFVLPILILLVFGVIEFGNTYNNYLSVRGGTRDGARQASVGNFGSTTSCNNGTYGGGNASTQKIMCLTKDRTGLHTADVSTMVIVDSAGYTVGNSIVVCAQTPIKSFTGLFAPFLNGRFLKTKVQMRIETVNATAPANGSETAPTGSDWSFCTLT